MPDSFVESLFSPSAPETPSAPAADASPASVAAPETAFAPPPSSSPTAAAPAPDAFAPAAPAAQGQPETPAPAAVPAPAAPNAEQPATPAPVIPPEYTQAHDFWSKTQEAAAPIGGIEMVPHAVQWTSLLFGLGETPVDPQTGQRVAAESHFLNTLQQTDPTIYSAMASELIHRHKPAILASYTDELLSSLSIPKDRLKDVQDFLAYGYSATDDDSEKSFLAALPDPALAQIYKSATPAYRAHLLNSLPQELAIKELQREAQFQAFDQREAQTKEAQVKAAEEAREFAVAQVREEQIQKSEQAFITSKSKELGVPEQQVTDWLQLVGLEMDREANRAEQELKQIYRNASPEQLRSLVTQKSEVARVWNGLTEACKSGNDLRINAAMNQFRLLVETRFHNFLAGRKSSPAPATPAAPAAPGPRDPQFPAPPPPVPNNGGNSFVESLFGKGDPQSSWQ